MDSTNGDTFIGQMIEMNPGKKNTTEITAWLVSFFHAVSCLSCRVDLLWFPRK